MNEMRKPRASNNSSWEKRVCRRSATEREKSWIIEVSEEMRMKFETNSNIVETEQNWGEIRKEFMVN